MFIQIYLTTTDIRRELLMRNLNPPKERHALLQEEEVEPVVGAFHNLFPPDTCGRPTLRNALYKPSIEVVSTFGNDHDAHPKLNIIRSGVRDGRAD